MYILDYNQQLNLIREMTQLRKDAENWVVYYHHPSTNEMWKSFFPKATDADRGPKILRTEPVPERLEDQLKQCLSGDIEENAIGLGIELSVNPQKWDRILAIIENNYRDYERNQLSLFLENLGLEKKDQLFREIGHSPADFGITTEKMNDLAWRSKKVRFKRFWFF
jgi:hypothetical protein